MTDEPATIRAPFTDEQVASLNAYQKSGVFHDFTCGDEHAGERSLIATREGWICPTCEYTQVWAWLWMADCTWEQFKWFDRTSET